MRPPWLICVVQSWLVTDIRNEQVPILLWPAPFCGESERGVWTRLIIIIILRPDSLLASAINRRGAQCVFMSLMSPPRSLLGYYLSCIHPTSRRSISNRTPFTPTSTPLQGYHMASVMGGRFESNMGFGSMKWLVKISLLFTTCPPIFRVACNLASKDIWLRCGIIGLPHRCRYWMILPSRCPIPKIPP